MKRLDDLMWLPLVAYDQPANFEHWLYTAQEGACFSCGLGMLPRAFRNRDHNASDRSLTGWTRDHVRPMRSKTGQNNASLRVMSLRWNMVLMHAECNKKKADRHPTPAELQHMDALHRYAAYLWCRHTRLLLQPAYDPLPALGSPYSNDHGLPPAEVPPAPQALPGASGEADEKSRSHVIFSVDALAAAP